MVSSLSEFVKCWFGASRLPRPPVLLALCLVMSGVASPQLVFAQDWRFEPIVRIGGEYDDNAYLIDTGTADEIELAGLLLNLRVDIKYASPKTELLLQPQFVLRNYPDDPESDSDDVFVEGRFTHRGQSNTFGVSGRYEDQSIRTAERIYSDLDVEDPDEIFDDDTGRVLLSGERSKLRLTPVWDYRLSNVSSIGAFIDYFDVQYEGEVERLLTDYTNTLLNLNYRRRLSDVNTAILAATGSTFDSAGANDDITGYGLQAGIERALSQKTRLKVLIGMEEIQQTGFESDPEVVGEVRLTRTLEIIRMFVQYRRSVSGTGANGIAARDSLNVNFRRRLSEKTTAGLGIRGYRSRGVTEETLIDDRDYFQLHANFQWYLSRSLVIEADYRYTIDDREETFGTRANSNQINLWFTYQPRSVPRI
jgi:hypothetical protein